MTDKDKSKSDDFFRLLEKEQQIENPFAADEILFRDQAGNLKVLKAGEILDFEKGKPPVMFEPASFQPPAKDHLTNRQAVKLKPRPAGLKIGLSAERLAKVAKPLNIDKEIDLIIKRSGVNLSDPEDWRRFKNIISSRLKEVRDQIQVREMLLSS